MAEYNAGTVKATMTADGRGYHATVDGIVKKDQELKRSAQEVTTSYKEMGIAVGASFAAITAGIWKSIDANNRLKSAMMGLDSIATGTVGTYSKIQAELERIREEGMIPLNNAITAYKNLLMRYQDEETAIRMFNRLADAAAFGRQGQLSLGEAIQSATEGLKNENSVLVDNAGVTKNVSVMWKEYADQLGKTVSQLTDVEKRQAEINGVMEETRHQVGDLAKLQNTLQGELAKSGAVTRDTAAAFGDAMEPAVSAVVSAYSALMLNVKSFISTNPEMVSGVTAGAFAFTGLATAMAGVSALIPKLVAGFQALFIKSGPVGWGILAVSALTAALVGLHTAQQKQLQQMKEQAKEFNQQSREIHDLTSEYKELSTKTEKTADEKERLKQISERLIELVPGMVKGYDDEGNAILDLNVALEAMVNKKREALQVDRQLLDKEIKDAERRRGDLAIRMAQAAQQRAGVSEEMRQRWILDYQEQIAELDEEINDLLERRAALEEIIQGTTVESLRVEYERQRAAEEAARKAAEEARKREEEARRQQALEEERKKLLEELADRIFELTHIETEVKLRELDKQLAAYRKAEIEEIEIEGEKYTLAQWYELEKTRILDEETEKRKKIEQELLDWQTRARLAGMDDFEKQITQYELDRQAALEAARAKFKEAEQLKQAEAAINEYYDALITQARDEEAEKQKQIVEDLAKWQEDWQNRARLALMEEYDQRVAQYELDREAALREAKKKLEDEEQYKQAELAINQYYDALITQVRAEQDEEEKRARDQRIRDTEEAIRREYGLEQQLTEWGKKELLQRLQNELTALEAMEEASAERIEALKNVIDDLSREIPDLTDMTRQWTEGLVDGLSRAIVEGESLADVFDNLLRTITQYFLKQAMMGGLSAIGFPSFHGSGEVPQRFHWGGVVDAFAGAIRAHGGLKLAADEVPIIAQTGERILSRAQNVAYEAGMKPEVKIEIINNTGTPIQAEPEVSVDGAEMVVSLLLEGHRRNIGGIQKLLPFRR